MRRPIDHPGVRFLENNHDAFRPDHGLRRRRARQPTLGLPGDLEQPLAAADRRFGITGASPGMRRLDPILERYATSDATMLITGETGTGKELVAEAIHRASSRACSTSLVCASAARTSSR
jgi:DNA-binding NtrC family response regulator